MSLAAAGTPTAEQVVVALQETRERTLRLVDGISDADLERVHSTLMSPLVWDLGHIAAFEDLWLVHRYGGRELLRDELMDVYDAFETPRARRGELPFLGAREAFEFLAEVRGRTLAVIDERGVGDGFTHELVIRHELQHGETMLQTLGLARLPARGAAREAVARSHDPGAGWDGLDMVEVPGGAIEIGAPATGFAYDNERPRHRTDVCGFQIGRVPITNATYLTFVEGGGYERREWWTDEGWAWKEEYDITRPGGWTEALDAEWRVDGLHPLDAEAPVVHVSWFEADAFARAHDARLPTEFEWERAATWNQAPDAPALDGIGCVWEWTAGEFDGYPGFAAHPYPEYSEVFFGQGYRVLRGGSWATDARVRSPHFRNWDFPQRRQIFSGLRIARDA